MYTYLVTSILYSCGTWTRPADPEKRIQAFEIKCMRKLLHIPYFEHMTNDWVQSKVTPLRVQRDLFWQLSRDENLHGSGMSHAVTACPKPSFRAPWRMGDAVVSRENAGWITLKGGHPCPCQNCSQRPPAEKTGRGSVLNCPSLALM